MQNTTKNINERAEVPCLVDLSIVENNNSVLYNAFAERLILDSAKSILLSIASNHAEHAEILKAASKDSESVRVQAGKCNKEFAGVFGVAYDIYKQIIDEKEISAEELSALVDKLFILERALAEKYMNVRPDAFNCLENAFLEMVHDCEHHIKLLTTVKALIEPKTQENHLVADVVAINRQDCIPTQFPYAP